ncbi:MAG: outer membrane protein transport protein [Bacteroidia bacterium]
MLKRLLFSLLFFSSASFVHAGGFQVNAQGQKQLGMGHTGTAFFWDASTLFFNPGGACFLPYKFMANGGATFLIPRSQYAEPSPGVYTESMVHHIGTPFNLYAAWRPDSLQQLSVGIAVYTPFGSRAQWPDDWKGQFLIREIDLKTIFIQPTVSWKMNNVGIGIGFVYATGGFSLRKGVPVQNNSGEYGEANLHGAASGVGFNAGIYYTATRKLSLGLSYRSSVKVNVKNGSADFTVPASLAEYFPKNTFSTSIKLPQVISGGLGYRMGKWKLALDVNMIGWHSYDTLRIDFAVNTDKLADVHDARSYKDAFIIRIGAQYKLTENIDVRAGMYYDISPVKDGYLTPETPDADRLGITCGTSIQFGEKFSADIALLYIEGMKRSDTNLATGFSGTYKSRVIAPSIGVEYKFRQKRKPFRTTGPPF